MISALVTLAAVLCLALLLNRLDARKCRGRRLDPIVDGTPAMLVFVLYSVLLAVSGRSWFSGLLVTGGALLLFAVNRLKLSQFKEPLIFVDFGLFAQMLRHPRFYFPYIFPLPVMLTVGALLAVVAGLFYIQPPLAETAGWLPRLMLLVSVCLVGFVAWCFTPMAGPAVRRMLEQRLPSSDPNTDFQVLGLTGSILVHTLAHWHRDGTGGTGEVAPADHPSPAIAWPQDVLDTEPANKPHVVLVQAESFFDVRRVDPAIDRALFRHYDAICEEAEHGEMTVSAHGAYTMRTEFSVLTGIPNSAMSTDGMNPYLTAARRPVWSLARHFKALGYRTICVHPYDLRFFRRDKVMPNLGFDELHGEGFFPVAPRFGPYISDDALARYINDLMEVSDKPLFIFAITIEAHGPWDGERFVSMERAPNLVEPPAWGGLPMATYLTHLQNTDNMFATLTATGRNGRPRVVGAYGDHVGCVPEDRCTNPNTDYFVWSSHGRTSVKQAIKAEDMGGRLLSAVLNIK